MILGTLLSPLVLTGLRPVDSIPASSPLVAQIGRFDKPAPDSVRCSWSGAALELRVQGSTLTATITDVGDNYLEEEINGQPTYAIRLQPGSSVYTVRLPPGPCRVRLVKRTESFVGPITFEKFQAAGGEFFADRAPRRLIEFIGDSITCGYGNEGQSEHEHFKTATENADMSYAWIAARQLNAKASLISWSGRKMWPDNTVPSIYDLTIPTEPGTTWDFAAHEKPDVILINLATNDFGRENPDKAQWCAGYEAFLVKLRGLYPKAMIYCAIGSMMSDGYPVGHNALTTVRGYIATIVADRNKAGDAKVGGLEFDMQKQSDGLGSDYHPSVKTDGIMAAKLVDRIKSDLHW